MSPQEVEAAVEKIRRSYDDYMVRYMKDRRARDAFEQRYFDIRKARVDLDRFIIDELRWVQQLEAQAKDEKIREYRRREKRGARGGPGGAASGGSPHRQPDFADRVLAELRKRIEKYPAAGLEAEEVYEVDKLYGALGRFERDYWPKVDRLYRKVYPSRYSGPRILIENRLFTLAEPTSDRLSPQLQGLVSLLGAFPRKYREIEWECKQCILTASFFLHMVEEELNALRKEEVLGPKEVEAVETALDFVHTVIEDFRLTDLKETNGRR